jgi:predicted amidohydrolase
MIRLAACQYAIELHQNWDAYADHLQGLCAEAAGQGAQLLLLPEYAGLVLSGQLPAEQRGDLQASIAGIQPLIEPWLGLCEGIARRWGIYLQPGSTGAGR